MSAFHYVTFKYVVIKDKRLGAAYYIVALIILVYTLAQILIHKAYLELDTSPRATLRLIVTRPPQKNEDDYAILPYCCNQTSQENSIGSSQQSKCFTCKKLDAISLNWPTEGRAVSIATFIKENYEKTGLLSSDPEKYISIRAGAYFTVNPEDVLFKVEHSVSALTDYGNLHTASHRKMRGRLEDCHGNTIKWLSNGKDSKVDKIRLHELLEAANLTSLDDASDALNANGRTYRENGVILRVHIHYDNVRRTLLGTGPLEYTYRVEKAPFSDYRTKQEIEMFESMPSSASAPRQRLVKKRYCTRVEFTQTGKIGKFSLANLLLQLVASMGLLTLSGTIIDTVALYVIPAKSVYREYVYDSSPEIRTLTLESDTDQQKKDK